jgi:hypothetical protein
MDCNTDLRLQVLASGFTAAAIHTSNDKGFQQHSDDPVRSARPSVRYAQAAAWPGYGIEIDIKR